MFRRIRILVVLGVVVGFSPRVASAQAVQAVRSLDGIHDRENRQAIADKIQAMLDELRARRSSLELKVQEDRSALARADGTSRPDLVSLRLAVGRDSTKLADMTSAGMFEFERRARATIEARGDAREFTARLENLNHGFTQFAPELNSAGMTPERTIGIQVADPTPFELIPHLAFVTGLDWTASAGSIGTAGLGIYTNLVGEAVSSAVGAVSTDKFKNYVADHTSVGTSFALSKHGRPSGQLGLGLGRFSLRDCDIWAVLNFDQFDNRDPRVPASVKGTKPDQGAWSTPTLSISFSPFSAKVLRDRIGRAQLVPFFNVGIGAPHYYPGNLFQSLGALFTENRKNYVQADHPRFTVAMSTPIMPFASRATSSGN